MYLMSYSKVNDRLVFVITRNLTRTNSNRIGDGNEIESVFADTYLARAVNAVGATYIFLIHWGNRSEGCTA